MKSCPYCASQIQDAAIKCRYCGMFLTPESLAKQPPTPTAVTSMVPSSHAPVRGPESAVVLPSHAPSLDPESTSPPPNSDGRPASVLATPEPTRPDEPPRPQYATPVSTSQPSSSPAAQISVPPLAAPAVAVFVHHASPPPNTAETVFYSKDGIKITNTRAIFENSATMFSMANVTSVRMRADGPRRHWPILLGLFGGVLCTVEDARPAGLVIVLVSIAWSLLQKTHYKVMVGAGGGEREPYSSTNAQHVAEIVAAMNEAFIQRG